MKKLLLSSIIMFGVCGIVTAQSATDSKFNKKTQAATTTSAAAPTPQKAAIMPSSDAVVSPVERTDADKAAAAAAPVAAPQTKAQIKAAQAAQAAATSVSVTGEVIMSAEEKEKAGKAAAEKAASVKKNQQ